MVYGRLFRLSDPAGIVKSFMISPSDIFVAIPSRGQVLNDVANATIKMCHAYGLPLPEFATGHLTATDGRNKIRKTFLASGCEILLMIDYDVIPVSGVIEIATRGLDICAVPVMLMAAQANIPFWNVYREDKGGDGWWPIDNIFAQSSIVECDAVGFGVVAIHRRVVEALPPFWLDVDAWGIANRSEDLPYCREARRRGFRVWADFGARADHITAVNLRDLQERNSAAFERLIS